MRSAGAKQLVVLRRLAAEDLDLVHRWYQDEQLFADLVGPYMPRPREEAVAWMARHWLDPDSLDTRLAICRAVDGLHIGNVYLTAIDPGARNADFHILIGSAADRGKGYGTAATRAAISHAVTHIHVRRLRLEVLSRNLGARRVYEKCGFVVETVRPRAVRKPDGWLDVCVMVRVIGGGDGLATADHATGGPTCPAP